ncbi:MAG TPA: hypothetical protein VMD31_15455 [Opitutaceae bacterium]|nr:hypothetical protein [Opitutaceae bacterium]
MESSSHREATYICSGCLTQHPRARIHVLPTWNEHVADFVTSFRCDRCWQEALAWTRLKAAVLTPATREQFCQFLERHGGGEAAGIIRQATLEDAACQVGIVLDCIEGDRLRLMP